MSSARLVQDHSAHGSAAAVLALHEMKRAKHMSTCSFCCFKDLSPAMSCPELGCSTTVHMGVQLPHSRCTS